ncbi:MAG: MFS transporter [Planctomycetes bacterium]|nr:MFS transporter [Planctomycetota bacterium]
MGSKNGKKKGLGPLPTLFVGVGPCAERTLSEFSGLARRLTIPIQGPFGLVLADSYCEDLFKCDWPWVSDFKIPDASVLRDRSEFVGRDDAKLLTLLSSLVRRLRSVGQVADPGGPGRLRMCGNVLLDLSDPGVVPSAVRLMQALRKVDPALDVTVLGLTDRTAVTDSTCDSKWFDVWKQLLADLQNEPLAQRVYLLDGCDAERTWLERPEQLHQLGAEFLLHHGLTCRSLLRQGERARTAVTESLLHVCGSFGCRTIQADLSVVAERIAEKVAAEDLRDLYARPLPDGWAESLDEQSQSLVERIAGICEKAHQTRAASSNDRRDRSGGLLPGDTEIDEAVAKAIRNVCSREPLPSLCHFFSCLQPKLGKLLTRYRLWERVRIRRSVADAFRRQESSTYEPMRTWMSQPETEWADRFTPQQGDVSHVAVGRPASRMGYLGGMLFLMIGLASISAGLIAREMLFVIGGGLLSLAASVLMTLPTGWVRHPRNRIREGQDVSASGPMAAYRKRPGRWGFCVAAGTILAGLVGLTWPLWPGEWTSISTVWAVATAVIASVGIASVIGCPSQTHPDRVDRREALGHVSPPAWRCRGAGVACLALAWVVFCLGLPTPSAPQSTLQWVSHCVGLVLVAGGTGWILLPRTGYAYFVDRVPKMPLPLVGGIGHPAGNHDMGPQLAAMTGWINRLTLEPSRLPGAAATARVPRGREILFDFLAADWEDQLAEAFRMALEARSGKSLLALALQPALWTECVTKELQDPHATSRDLTCVFTLQAVKAWIESHTLAELLSLIKVDVERFAQMSVRLAVPHWPTPRLEPDFSAGVIAVAKPLWDLLAPVTQAAGPVPIVPLDWDIRSDAIVVVRIVQGLTEGWRGFPGLPGQAREADVGHVGQREPS